jgi:hypothetical protein
VDAGTNPKFASYAHAKVVAGEASPEQRNEYLDRSAYLKDAIRRDIPKGQGMLDLWGHRDDTEGLLSPSSPTPMDSWMEAAALGRNIPSRKAIAALPRSPKGEIARGDGSVQKAAVKHSVLDLATRKTGELLGKRYQLPFQVPSTLTQETVWDAVRGATRQSSRSRQATANSALNAYRAGEGEVQEPPPPRSASVRKKRLF